MQLTNDEEITVQEVSPSIPTASLKKRFLLSRGDEVWEGSNNKIIKDLRNAGGIFKVADDTQKPVLHNDSCDRTGILIDNENCKDKSLEELKILLGEKFSHDKAEKILTHYHQLLAAFVKNSINSSLFNPKVSHSDELHDPLMVSPDFDYKGNIYKEKDEIYLEIDSSRFKIVKVLEVQFNIPGNVKTRFKLTEEGFQFERQVASNSLLFQLMTADKKSITITEADVRFAESEENLFSITESDHYDEDIKQKVRAVLDAVIEHKSIYPLDTLTDVLESTAQLITSNNPINTESLKNYFNVANTSTTIDNAMLALAKYKLELASSESKDKTECDFLLNEKELTLLINSNTFLPQISQQGQAVLNAVRKKKNSLPLDNLNIILNKAAEFMKTGKIEDWETYSKIVQDFAKDPNGKIISGAMMALTGAILVALSLTLVVTTCGVSTPLSAIGITVGTSAVIAGVTGAIAGCTMLTSIGGTIFGIKNVIEGFKEKITKNTLLDLIENSHETRNINPGGT